MGALGTSSVNLDSEGHFIIAQQRREKIFFDEGASCLCFVGVEGTCIFSRGYHSADRPIKLSGSHRTQTQTSEVRLAARSNGH